MSKKRKQYTQLSYLPKTLVSIIIPVHRRFDILAKCLEAIPAAFDEIDYEVILIDNNSPNEEKIPFYKPIRTLPHYRVYEWSENRGFPKACNFGAKQANSPLLFFLNSDVIMSPHSGAKTVALLDNPQVAIAGMKLLFPESSEELNLNQDIRPRGKVQHVGIAVNIRGDPYHVLNGWSSDNPKVMKIRDVHMTTGAALMTRKNLFLKVGGFFEGYGMGCLTGDTFVYTDFGIQTLKSLIHSENVNTFPANVNLASEKDTQKATLSYKNGTASTLKIKLQKGFTLQGTLNHKIRVMNDDGTVIWKELQDLHIGDFVAVRYGMNMFGPLNLPKDDAYLFGLYLAEGCYEKKANRITITTADKEIQEFLLGKDFLQQSDSIHFRKGTNSFIDWTKDYVDLSKKSFDKEISDFFLCSDRETQVALLQGMFDGDGCAIKDGRINYSTSSYTLAKQLQMVLLNFGIVVGIHRRTSTIGRVNYLLDFGSDSKTFYDEIGFRLNRKQERKDLVRTSLSPNIPHQRTHFKSLYQENDMGYRNWKELGMHSSNPAKGVRRDTIELLLQQNLNYGIPTVDNLYDHFKRILGYECVWLKVRSIDDGGIQETFDLHIPTNHAYVANGLIVHNTFEDCDYCLAVRSLGYNICIDPTTYAIHYTGATAEGYQMQYPLNENKLIFMQRWMGKISYSDWMIY